MDYYKDKRDQLEYEALFEKAVNFKKAQSQGGVGGGSILHQNGSEYNGTVFIRGLAIDDEDFINGYVTDEDYKIGSFVLDSDFNFVRNKALFVIIPTSVRVEAGVYIITGENGEILEMSYVYQFHDSTVVDRSVFVALDREINDALSIGDIVYVIGEETHELDSGTYYHNGEVNIEIVYDNGAGIVSAGSTNFIVHTEVRDVSNPTEPLPMTFNSSDLTLGALNPPSNISVYDGYGLSGNKTSSGLYAISRLITDADAEFYLGASFNISPDGVLDSFTGVQFAVSSDDYPLFTMEYTIEIGTSLFSEQTLTIPANGQHTIRNKYQAAYLVTVTDGKVSSIELA